MTIPGLTSGHLDRLHRFTRLWRKLGWTIRELDLTIQAFGGTLTPDTLLGLAVVHRLKQQLDLPIDFLVGGLSLLEVQPWTEYLESGQTVHLPLYSTIFQRETLRSAGDFAVFSLPIPILPAVSAELISHAAYVGACLGLKSSVVQSWVSDADGLGIANELNLDNLSRLTSAAGLCRGLRLDPEKLTFYLKVFSGAISPFQPGMSTAERAKAMLQFSKQFRLAQRSGADVETLHYLLQLPHETSAGVDADIDEKQLADLSEAAQTAGTVDSRPARTDAAQRAKRPGSGRRARRPRKCRDRRPRIRPQRSS